MGYKTDIEIAQAAEKRPVADIAASLGLAPDEWEPWGWDKAKLSLSLLVSRPVRPDVKLILVTAISPTAAGEGKTTVSVGLADALARLGKRVVLALREPSLGPVFGVKGGAAGGGYAQVVPMEALNLHFTGDLHAVTAANNLLAALIDNHLQQDNALGLDPRRITWRRCQDVNDRALRHVVVGLRGPVNGMPREDGFDITAASEVMATLCLASDLADLKVRLRRLVVGRSYEGRLITCGDLKAEGALAALLADAVKPNLVQTLAHTPVLVHGGPFANIAHGCNSVIATRLALGLGDVVVTEAGFGADLGAEKFIDIKCRQAGLTPSACVVVATLRALKHHGGAARGTYDQPDAAALERGLPNLLAHVENVTDRYGLPAVVALNRFPTDTDEEIEWLQAACERRGFSVVPADVWARGGAGGEALAARVLAAAEGASGFRFVYSDEDSLVQKIETLVRKVYGGDGLEIEPSARRALDQLEAEGYGRLPVCMAKTQYSLSDDPKKLGRPAGFRVKVTGARLSAGAGFVVVYTGEIMTMPGLPKRPAAEGIDIDADGVLSGLF
ncbi:MAG: formate--tetrahydrofolate ligase [Oscillospiraceae bacterium]|jgi:formate--tetrahydrofolate ligase|nr:formate--tetrahydrofolate ligase [Oscillospiraceae bacterium]